VTPQQKEDLVCPFHGDLEQQLSSMNDWLQSIDDKLSNLLLWKASVIGYAAGSSAIVIIVFKALRVI
jgi:hypothetical protein